MTAHPADPVAPSDRPHRREMPPTSPASGLGTLLRLTLRLARRRLIWWTLAVAVLGYYVSHTQLLVAYPGVTVVPYLSPLALALGVLGALPAVATPVPATAPVRREVTA